MIELDQKYAALIAALLALASATFFGLALVLTQFGLRHLKAADGVLVTIPGMTLLFWIIAPCIIALNDWHWDGGIIFAAAGLFYPAVISLLTYESNQRIGPAITGALGSISPLFAALVGLVIFGEQLTLLSACALMITMLGVATVSWRGESSSPSSLFAFLLSLTAAALRAAGQAIIKLGLALWPSAFAATLIGYSISTVVVIADARLRRGIRQPVFTVAGVLWFSLVGLSNGAAVYFLYTALKSGKITLVAPIVATYPMFALLFGVLLLSGQRITVGSGVGIVLVVSGTITLLLSQAT